MSKTFMEELESYYEKKYGEVLDLMLRERQFTIESLQISSNLKNPGRGKYESSGAEISLKIKKDDTKALPIVTVLAAYQEQMILIDTLYIQGDLTVSQFKERRNEVLERTVKILRHYDR